MAYDEAPAERVRDWPSAGRRGSARKKMFGGLTFLTHGRLTVGVYGAGLIGSAGMGAAVAEPVVRPFAMTGRPMGEIIVMAADALAAGVGCPLQH